MKPAYLIRAGLIGAAGLVLAACGGGHNDGVTVLPTTPTTTTRYEDQFGTQFGVDYRASPNSQPVKPAAGDIIPLSLTNQPLSSH